MNSKPDITVIGPGAVGSSLIKNLSEAGYPIASVISRRFTGQNRPGYLSGIHVTGLKEASDQTIGDLVFITSPDDAISGIAEAVSSSDISWNGRTVVHCSGFLTSGSLQSLQEKGAAVAAFHPLQTFIEQSDSDPFNGIYISLEGDAKAVELLKTVAADLGAKPVPLNREQKSILHVAAVFMSNYVVALGSIAGRLIKENIPDADLSVLMPLLVRTVSNLEGGKPADVLSGPVARGDSQTVRQHLDVLKDKEQMLMVYKLMGREALRLAEQKGGLPAQSLQELQELLRTR
jgi:predicted short-subunit dehydrogenase-like oxidoreductase (DUF2520 family)